MIKLNLPVALFTILARRFVHFRGQHLVPVIFPNHNPMVLSYAGTQSSILISVALAVYYVYKKYRDACRRKPERRQSYNVNYSPRRLCPNAVTRHLRRPWYLERSAGKTDVGNRYVTSPSGDRRMSRRELMLPHLNLDFSNKPLQNEEVDNQSVSSAKKPGVRMSHQSTMITDSLITLNESTHFPNAKRFLNELTNTQLANQQDEMVQESNLQPIVNFNENCINLVSKNDDVKAVESNSSILSSIFDQTCTLDHPDDSHCKYNELNDQSGEISSVCPGNNNDTCNTDMCTPITSDMSIESYVKPKKKRRYGKTRFSVKKRRNQVIRKKVSTPSTSLALNRTRSGRVYSSECILPRPMTSATTSKRSPRKQ